MSSANVLPKISNVATVTPSRKKIRLYYDRPWRVAPTSAFSGRYHTKELYHSDMPAQSQALGLGFVEAGPAPSDRARVPHHPRRLEPRRIQFKCCRFGTIRRTASTKASWNHALSQENIRLHAISYRGRAWFFITLCCESRSPVFSDGKKALWLMDHLKSTAEKCHFGVHAFCLMPDHFHALVEGVAPESDLLLFVRIFKQATSREYSRESGVPLWQKKFYDRILRPEDSPEAVSWYIWMNPVREGLCSQPNQYPYSGSFTEQWENKSQPQNQWMPTWKKDQLGPSTNRTAPTRSSPP